MARLSMCILWPAFLAAIVGEGVLFSLIDPRELALLDSHVELSPFAVYTIGFVCLWSICSLASVLTYYLSVAPDERHRAG